MLHIPIPGLKSNIGLGDAIAQTPIAKAVGAVVKKLNHGKPCGGCQKREERANALPVRLVPYSLPVPPGYTMRRQGFRLGGWQVLLLESQENPGTWGTLEFESGGPVSPLCIAKDEAAARRDYDTRMTFTYGRQ